jgi:hypothetical protein
MAAQVRQSDSVSRVTLSRCDKNSVPAAGGEMRGEK